MKPQFIAKSWSVADAKLGGSVKLLRQAKRRDRRDARHTGKAILRRETTVAIAETPVFFPNHIPVESWDQIFWEIENCGYTSPENFWQENFPELCLEED